MELSNVRMTLYIEIYDQVLIKDRKRIPSKRLQHLRISILGKHTTIWDMEHHMFGKTGKMVQASAEIALKILHDKKSIVPIHHTPTKSREQFNEQTGCKFLEYYAWHLEQFASWGKQNPNCTFMKFWDADDIPCNDREIKDVCLKNGCYDRNAKLQKPGKCLFETAVPCDDPECTFLGVSCSAEDD